MNTSVGTKELQALLDYLQTRPYNEVAILISNIVKTVVAIPEPTRPESLPPALAPVKEPNDKIKKEKS